LAEYNNYIIDIIYCIKSEKELSLKERITAKDKKAIALEFCAHEWFRELSEEIQEIALDNLQIYRR
jgi:hypothetical protein